MDSIKALLTQSSELIEKKWDLVGNGNMAKSPVMIIYIGDEAFEASKYIENPLHNSWLNSEYIPKIHVMSGDGNKAVLCANKKLEFDEFSGTLEDVVDFCIRERLLNTMDVFLDMQKINIECVATGDEPILYDILKRISEIKSGLVGITIWKALYLLINQSNQNKQKDTEKFIMRFNADFDFFVEQENVRQLYLVSNFLKSGHILSEQRIIENYNLVGSIIVLKNNCKTDGSVGAWYYDLNESRRINTVAYQLVGKPCREIATATYIGILREILDCSINKNIDLEFTSSNFTFFEDYFRNHFLNVLPNSSQIEYMAWNPSVSKSTHGRTSVNDAVLNEYTNGQWSEFYKLNYERPLNQIIGDNSFEDELNNYLIKKFNYKEMIEVFKTNIARNVTGGVEVNSASGSNLYGVTAEYGRSVLRNKYLTLARNLYIRVLDDLYKKAERFEKIIIKLENNMPRAAVTINKALYESVDDYYRDLVRDWINSDEYNRKEFRQLMNVRLDERGLLDGLMRLFESLVKNLSVYTMDFENELSTRLQGTSGNFLHRNDMIHKALDNNIENSRRLTMINDFDCESVCQVYLGNPNAEFVQKLMQNNSQNVFDSERSDRVENIIIYKIKNLQSVFNLGEEE